MELFIKQLNANTKNEKLYHIFEKDKKLSIKNLLAGPTKTTWQKGLDNELGRLANEFYEVKGTNTIVFIRKDKVTKEKKLTYAIMV